ncbi:hypothetical protein [Mariniblastus fucicola]|uniref:hypothetical protein n=1 Tax=Mariniblastus fucicola TaxID=980251 RepID=UPI0011E050E4|nr:hypothetical protein [Mariniblastus fucicola]
MARDSWLVKVVFFPLLVGAVFVVGAMIPTFYDWSGADQSRPSPSVGHAFYAVIGFMIATWIALPWLPWCRHASPDGCLAAESSADEKTDLDSIATSTVQLEDQSKFQFNLRTLIVITTCIAITIAGLTSFRLVTTIWLIALGIVLSAWFVTHLLSWRWQLGSLIACMYFPYAWVVISDEFRNFEWEHVLAAFGLPAFVPSILAGRFLFDFRGEDNVWLLLTLTGVELAFGLWMIHSGPRRTTVWMILVLFISLIGSGFLNAAIRI